MHTDRTRVLQVAAAVSAALLALLPHVGSVGLAGVLFGMGLCSVGWNGVFVATVSEAVDAHLVGVTTGRSMLYVNLGAAGVPPLIGRWRPSHELDGRLVLLRGAQPAVRSDHAGEPRARPRAVGTAPDRFPAGRETHMRGTRICVIRGDGVGQEVVPQAMRVLSAVAAATDSRWSSTSNRGAADYYRRAGRDDGRRRRTRWSQQPTRRCSVPSDRPPCRIR